MTNAELIKALRYCGNFEDREGCDEECPYFNDKDCPKRIMRDAADALEAAEKRIAVLEAQMPKLPDRQEFLAKGSFIEEPLSRPKEGEWIMDGMYEYELSYGCVGYEPIYRCSKCGITTESYLRTERPIMPEDADFPNYCPNCGAKMQTVTNCHALEEENDEQ